MNSRRFDPVWQPSDGLATTDAPRPGDSYVQSFARGLEVIRSFSRSAPAQTLSEVPPAPA